MKYIKKLENIMLYYCIFYLCTFYLFDVMVGRIFKYIFFACLIYGIIGYFFRKLISKSLKYNTVFILGVAVFLVFVFQCFNVKESEQMMRGFYQYPFYLLIICSTSYMSRNVNIDNMIKLLTRYGVVLSVCALYEQISHHYIVGVGINGYFYKAILVDENTSSSIRAAVFSGSPLVFGMLMAILTVISFYCLLQKKCVLNFIVMLANFFGLVLSYSRAPLVFTVISMAFMYLYYDNELLFRLKKSRVTKILFYFFLALLLLLLSSLFIPKVAFLFQRVMTIFNWDSNDANVTRFVIWQNVLKMIFDGNTFWIGEGPGYASGAIGFATESGVLKRLLELGVFSFFLYYFFLYRCVKKGTEISRKRNNKYVILSRSVILCILLEDIILQITESVSIAFFLYFFISLLYYQPSVKRN